MYAQEAHRAAERGAGGTMTPGPMEFRGPIGFRKAVGFSDSEDLFFSFWGSPNFDRKNGSNFGEDLFFGDHLTSAGKPFTFR